ncbi:unnamed protein product [Adineta steineri]|uniref:Peptidase C19 ubiquitin carboxyl-terminal hydrolase domain-containing protein n=1 Tax=Adineta steineri TaxID=433720 RepID=A0A819XXY9_9BILA|nr:unnamed protein product [Adineta steineri]
MVYLIVRHGIRNNNNNQNRMFTTTDLVHANQYQVPQLRGNQHHLSTPIQSNRLNRTPIKHEKSFRENERRLLGRNVPRLMMLHSDSINGLIGGTLHILLNTPAFVRIMSVLQNCLETNHFNLHLNSHILHERNFFHALSNILKAAYEKYQNDNTDISLVNDLCYKYDALYSHMRQWLQQAGNELLTGVMHTLRTIADQVHETESYSKSFDIKFLESVDNNQPEIKHYDAIFFLPNECDFQQYLNENFVGTVIEGTNEHSITRKFNSLPEVLIFTAKRLQNNQSTYDQYPTEIKAHPNQRYLLTSALTEHAVSCNYGRFIVVLCRQDSVYLLVDSQIIDRFHINCLSKYLKKVSPRIVIYNKIDPLRSTLCIFEDPLCGIPANKAFNNNSVSYETKQVAIPIPPSFSVIHDMNTPVIIRHPIESTIRFRMPSDSRGSKKVNAVSKLKDCLQKDKDKDKDKTPLYFSPYYIFIDSILECTLVSTAPDGQIYRNYAEFVCNEGSKQKFENPTYFNMNEINPVDGQWFPLNLGIIRPRQDVLKAERQEINETNKDKQHGDICQLVRFPDGQIEYIDEKKLLPFRKTGRNSRNKFSKQGTNNSRGVTPAELSKVFNLNTLRLAFRRVRKDPVTGEYVPDSDVLFYSNPFKLVSSTFEETDCESNPDLLQIIEISPSQILLVNEGDQWPIRLSYTISEEMYKCTSLNNKYLKVTVVNSTDKKPDVCPRYQILDNKKRVNSKEFSVNKYSDEIEIIIVKHATTDYYENSKLNEIFGDLSVFHNMSPTVTQNNTTIITVNPSMDSFGIQLEFGDSSNNERNLYPTAKYTAIITNGITSEEQQAILQSSESDHIQNNDVLSENFDELALHIKRPLVQENDSLYHPFMTTHQEYSLTEI